MKRLITTVAVAALWSSQSLAGGIEAYPTDNRFLFEAGTFVEFGVVYADGNNKGTETVGNGPAINTGDVTPAHTSYDFAIKHDLTDQWVVGLRAYESLRYRLAYPIDTLAPSAGTKAEYQGHEIDALARYKLNDNVSVFGGLRAEKITTMDTDHKYFGSNFYGATLKGNYNLGYMAGVAVEIPSKFFRADLTYASKIKHTLKGNEVVGGSINPVSSAFETPESLTLNVQGEIFPKTALFGSVRWRNWKGVNLASDAYGGFDVVNFSENSVDYQVGLGRQVSSNWFLYGSVGLSNPEGGIEGFDFEKGVRNYSVGAVFSDGPFRVTGGVTYGLFSDAHSSAYGVDLDFEDNSMFLGQLTISRSF